MNRFSFSPVVAGLVLGWTLAGCVASPEVDHPALEIEAPETWTAAEGLAGEPITLAGTLEADWWEDFGDPGLSEAVRLALERNFDLRAASARVDRAAAEARIAGSDLMPTLGGGLDYARQRRNFIGFPIPGGDEEVLSNTSTNWGLSLDTTWEIDLWGRIRAGTEAALADVEATEADYRAAALSIAGQTAKVWFAAAAAQLQIRLAEATVESFRTSYRQVRSRYESGVRSPLDVRLALSNLEDAEALLQLRREELDAAIRQLEVLLGRYPARRARFPEFLPAVPPEIPAGLPTELVTRRPDLAAAERRLAAADSRIREARRSLYPRLSLTASGGTASEEFTDLLDKDFRVWSILANLTQPIFQGGRLRAGVTRAEALAAEGFALYAASVLNAYAEVELALATEQFIAERIGHLDRATAQSKAAQELAEDRYRSGLEDYVTVLESQRRALTNEATLIDARRRRLDNRIDLYLALGGGFETPEDRVDLLHPTPETATAAKEESSP
jgi:NodT family efflux transporter outer membrane factor (OMF) lipoprotein